MYLSIYLVTVFSTFISLLAIYVFIYLHIFLFIYLCTCMYIFVYLSLCKCLSIIKLRPICISDSQFTLSVRLFFCFYVSPLFIPLHVWFTLLCFLSCFHSMCMSVGQVFPFILHLLPLFPIPFICFHHNFSSFLSLFSLLHAFI